MKHVWMTLCCFLTLAGVATAQPQPYGPGPLSGGVYPSIGTPASQKYGPAPRTIVNYQGPIDVVAGETVCYSLRACSLTFASGANAAINIRRASDSTLTDIVIMTNGNLDVATVASFSGIDATATCSSSASTTLTCTAATSQPATGGGDEISGTGITGPAYVTACSTFTAGAGTCTMNASATIASTTVTFRVGTFVRFWYDQTGQNLCAGTCRLGQPTAANQAILLLKCLGSSATLPCIASPLSGTNGGATAGTFTPATGVGSLVAVAERPGTGVAITVLRENVANNRISTATSPAWILTGGTSGTITAAAADATAHSVAAVLNGASSAFYVDNSATAGTVVGNTTAGAVQIFAATAIIYLAETGFYDNVALSASQAASLHANQSAYWGTP